MDNLAKKRVKKWEIFPLFPAGPKIHFSAIFFRSFGPESQNGVCTRQSGSQCLGKFAAFFAVKSKFMLKHLVALILSFFGGGFLAFFSCKEFLAFLSVFALLGEETLVFLGRFSWSRVGLVSDMVAPLQSERISGYESHLQVEFLMLAVVTWLSLQVH